MKPVARLALLVALLLLGTHVCAAAERAAERDAEPASGQPDETAGHPVARRSLFVKAIAARAILKIITAKLATDAAKTAAKTIVKDVVKQVAKDITKAVAKEVGKEVAKTVAKEVLIPELIKLLPEDLAQDVAKFLAGAAKDLPPELAKRIGEVAKNFPPQVADALATKLADKLKIDKDKALATLKDLNALKASGLTNASTLAGCTIKFIPGGGVELVGPGCGANSSTVPGSSPASTQPAWTPPQTSARTVLTPELLSLLPSDLARDLAAWAAGPAQEMPAELATRLRLAAKALPLDVAQNLYNGIAGYLPTQVGYQFLDDIRQETFRKGMGLFRPGAFKAPAPAAAAPAGAQADAPASAAASSPAGGLGPSASTEAPTGSPAEGPAADAEGPAAAAAAGAVGPAVAAADGPSVGKADSPPAADAETPMAADADNGAANAPSSTPAEDLGPAADASANANSNAESGANADSTDAAAATNNPPAGGGGASDTSADGDEAPEATTGRKLLAVMRSPSAAGHAHSWSSGARLVASAA